jgi:hypothetical protein
VTPSSFPGSEQTPRPPVIPLIRFDDLDLRRADDIGSRCKEQWTGWVHPDRTISAFETGKRNRDARTIGPNDQRLLPLASRQL